MEVGEICELTGAAEAAVVAVVEVFRREGRSFLMPPTTDALTGARVQLNRESLIDISHESLIRNWDRLKIWVDEESRSARIYRRLAETAVLYNEGKAGLWRDPDLGVALTWRELTNPNQVWARRYHPEFASAMNFLDESVTARDAQIAGEEARRRKEIKRTRLTALIFAIAFIFSLAMGVYAYGQKNEAQRQQTYALKAKDEAVAALKEAKEQRANAETQARIAGEKSVAAAVEKKNAEQQKDIALAKSKEATQQKQVAVRLNESVKTANKSLRRQFVEAGIARGEAEARREEAVQQKNLAVARQLRNVADSEWDYQGKDLVRSSLLAVESLKSAWTPEGYETLARGVNLLPSPTTKAWKAHEGRLLALAFSHNGRWLATKSTDGTRVWDVASQKELQHLQSPQDRITHTTLSFSPDDRWLVIGLGHFAGVWDTTTWKQTKELPNGQFVWSAAFSSDSGLLATAAYHSGLARVYETTTWTEIAKITPAEGGDVFAVAFVPNSRWLVTSANGGTKVWEVTKPQQQPLALVAYVTDPAGGPPVFSSDGRWLAMGSGHRDVRLWLVTRDANKTVKFTEFEREKLPLWSSRNPGEPEAFSSDGRYLVTMGADSIARVWDVASGEEITRVVQPATTATLAPDGSWLVTGHSDGNVMEWATDAKEAVRLEHGEKVQVKATAYSADGRWLATGSSDGSARVFQTTDWHEVANLKYEAEVSNVAFSPDSRWLIALNGNTVQMFETASWRKVISKQYEGIFMVAFSTDGQRVVVIDRLAVQLFAFEAPNWREVRLMKHEDRVISVFFSPDGKWLATNTEGGSLSHGTWIGPAAKTLVWDAATGEEVAWITHEHTGRDSEEPERPQAISGGRKELALESINWERAIDVRRTAEPLNGQWQASINPGNVQLSASNTTGRGVAIPHKNVNAIDFSPDGHWLATAGYDGTVRLWPLWREGIIKEACTRLPHNLSREDREKYLDDPNFPDTCPGLPVPEKKQ